MKGLYNKIAAFSLIAAGSAMTGCGYRQSSYESMRIQPRVERLQHAADGVEAADVKDLEKAVSDYIAHTRGSIGNVCEDYSIGDDDTETIADLISDGASLVITAQNKKDKQAETYLSSVAQTLEEVAEHYINSLTLEGTFNVTFNVYGFGGQKMHVHYDFGKINYEELGSAFAKELGGDATAEEVAKKFVDDLQREALVGHYSTVNLRGRKGQKARKETTTRLPWETAKKAIHAMMSVASDYSDGITSALDAINRGVLNPVSTLFRAVSKTGSNVPVDPETAEGWQKTLKEIEKGALRIEVDENGTEINPTSTSDNN